MKRALLPAIALMLLLSACGVTPAPTPPPIETASVSTTPEAASVTPTPQPDAEPSGLSPFATVVLKQLKVTRDRWEDNDENMIRETLEYYFLLRNDVEYEPGYAVPNFDPFFDESSPNYDDLVFDVDKARYYRLCADDCTGIAWYNTFVRFNSIEIDGDTARVEAYNLTYFVYEGANFMSGAGTTNYVELRKVDGVWRISDITAADSFHEMTHAELLEEIARLEGELS